MMIRGSFTRGVLFVLLVVMGTTISGCGTTAGPVGPEGPAGPQGPAGEDGNANVVAAVVELSNADWVAGSYVYQDRTNGSTSRSARVATLDVPEITQEIYDLGMVHVYLKVPEFLGGSPVAWAPLHYQYLAFGSAYYINIAFAFDVGTLKLYYFFTTNDGSVPPSLTDVTIPDQTYKYVIASAQAIESLASLGVDASDHDAVVRHLAR
jgi:hypothetical protein